MGIALLQWWNVVAAGVGTRRPAMGSQPHQPLVEHVRLSVPPAACVAIGQNPVATSLRFGLVIMPSMPEPVQQPKITPVVSALRTPASVDEPKTLCERCGSEMYRMHAVWRCPQCRFKTDCCGW